jgi:L-alanine-DL-glutamate epimerase-like enolase superfamily enzyme
MRIDDVHVDTLDIPFVEPLVSGTHRWERRRAGIVTIRVSDGPTGLGEYAAAEPGDVGDDVSAQLAATLEGIHLGDPVAIERSLRDIETWPFVGRAARSAVESALVDVLAQVSGVSMAAYLAPQPASEVAVNATLGIDPPVVVAARARALVGAGFRCLKLKAGDEPLAALNDRVAAVRDAVGPEVEMRVDFNGSLPLESAEAVLAGLAAFELEYAEQPIAATTGMEALAHLRWVGHVPIAADESVRDVGTARALLDSGAVDALVVKPARVGGLRQASAIVELATAAAVPVTVSTLFETGVGIAGAVHLAATAPGVQAHGLATADLLETDLLGRPLTVSHGYVPVPTGPGLGVALDRAAIERYRAT